MKEGETIDVTYGDRRGGSLGTQVQGVAREVAFPIFVSSGAAPRFLERFGSWKRATDVATLREQADLVPTLRVVGGQASHFHLVAPMEVAPGEAFDVRLSALDSRYNQASGYEGVVQVTTTDERSAGPAEVRCEGANAAIEGLTLNSPGFHRIYAIDANRVILGVSNPLRVKRDAVPVYWGELHGHSQSSDGVGTVDEHYLYARDVALLDFAAVSDHDAHLEAHPERWALASEKVKAYSDAGQFVALLAYEGRLRDPVSSEGLGDINVYYGSDEGNMLDTFPVPLTSSIVGGEKAFLVPHTSLYGPPAHMGTHWDLLEMMSAEVMPLVEVFSTHGNSEYYDCPRHVLWQARGQSVVEALKKGFRLGFIGSSDYHEVLTGALLRIQDTPRTINNQHMQARCGLAAVRAEELTRTGLLEAMKARRTYATSGIRAYVSLRVNGHEMGQAFSISFPTQPRELEIAVAAPELIVKLEVVRNGETIADLADGNWFVEATWIDEEAIPGGTFYYLRATTERTDFAWSSPVWVDLSD